MAMVARLKNTDITNKGIGLGKLRNLLAHSS